MTSPEIVMMSTLPAGVGDYGPGTGVAAAAAVCFAIGSVLQHHAAARSSSGDGLDVRGLLTHRAWLAGQAATALGSVLQVVALALAPVSIVQPLLAAALVVALAIRAVKDRCMPQRTELVGAVCTVAGLAVFLTAARPAPGLPQHLPSVSMTIAAVILALVLVAAAGRLPRGPVGALVCGALAGITGGTAAVLISTTIKAWSQAGAARGLGTVALVAAVITAVAAQLASQQAYSRGSLAWSLPALTLADPLAAVPVARLLLGERLEPGHAAVWVPAAMVAVAGVVLLARSGGKLPPSPALPVSPPKYWPERPVRVSTRPGIQVGDALITELVVEWLGRGVAAGGGGSSDGTADVRVNSHGSFSPITVEDHQVRPLLLSGDPLGLL